MYKVCGKGEIENESILKLVGLTGTFTEKLKR
jgi:hypothetical protein